MSDKRWQQIKSLFNAAMEQPPSERAAFLDRACGGDSELRSEVESLLLTRTQGAVRTGAAAEAIVRSTISTSPDAPVTEQAGAVIGAYKLLQVIGEGGFGTVFMAEQARPIRRRVALKIIKLGMDTRAVIARFEQERQALAVMDHPNIARVLDAGETQTGRPYFVMEYVKGDPITTFADAHTLSVTDRLTLFTQVCEAVQHAHTKGVIHRDLKPSNVLVSMVDGKPFAKVIDFGIAKATGAALTDKTLFTEHRQLIGTPEYMSPEQAEGSPDIDTRTDVYGLGVLLYELLTGLTPFDGARLRSAAFAELQRIIKEEEPPVPSVRVTRDLGTLAKTAAARREQPARLGTLIRGELDWIVMKALDKDRARRYETPNQFADDVRRHLSGEAVVAAPVSRGYRLRKFVRRNKGAVGAGFAIGFVLLLGLLGTSFGYVRARKAELNESMRAESEALARTDAMWSEYVARISAAQYAWNSNNTIEANHQLEGCPSELRGWEWRYLSSLVGHPRPFIRCFGDVYPSVSPCDASFLAFPRRDTAMLYDREGQAISPPMTSTRPLVYAGFSPDGRCIVTADGDTVQVWSRDGSSRICSIPFYDAKQISFSKDASLIRLTDTYSKTEIWSSGGTLVRSFTTNSSSGTDTNLVMSPDGTILANYNELSKTIVFDSLSSSNRIPNYVIGSYISFLHFLPDSRHCVIKLYPSGEMRILSLGSTISVKRLDGDTDCTHIQDSPTSDWFMTVSSINEGGSGYIRTWRFDGSPIAATLIPVGSSAVTISSDSTRIITRAGDTLWQITPDGTPMGSKMRHLDDVIWADYAPDGQHIYSMTSSDICIWNVDGQWINEIPLPDSMAIDATPHLIGKDGTWLLAYIEHQGVIPIVVQEASEAGHGLYVDKDHSVGVHPLIAPYVDLSSVRYLTIQNVSSYEDDHLRLDHDGLLWFSQAGNSVGWEPIPNLLDRTVCVLLSPDRTRYFTASNSGDIRIWTTDSMRLVCTLRGAYWGPILSLKWDTACDGLVSITAPGYSDKLAVTIREPSTFKSSQERRDMLARTWREADEYIEHALASSIPNDDLADFVGQDSAITPGLRFCAQKILTERLTNIKGEAYRAEMAGRFQEDKVLSRDELVQYTGGSLSNRVIDEMYAIITEYTNQHLDVVMLKVCDDEYVNVECLNDLLFRAVQVYQSDHRDTRLDLAIATCLFKLGKYKQSMQHLELVESSVADGRWYIEPRQYALRALCQLYLGNRAGEDGADASRYRFERMVDQAEYMSVSYRNGYLSELENMFWVFGDQAESEQVK